MRSIQKRAVLYLRVSTEEQVDNYSLKTQEEICKKEADKRGFKIEKIFKEEGKSAKSITGRPVLIKLLEYCRKNKRSIGALIVYRLDRISRQTGDYLAIRKRLSENGINILSASEPTGDSPTEKLIETILAGFAQLDNDIRGERSRNGMHSRFMSGLMNGKPPPGYMMVNAYPVEDLQSFDKMKQAWDIMATGTKSAREMAEILDTYKLKDSRSGKLSKFSYKQVYRIFRSKFYMGVLTSVTYQKEVQGQHIPMISREQFDKVQAIFDNRNPNKVNLALRNRNHEDFPLRRFMKCSKCKLAFSGSWSTGRGGKYAYYHCRSRCKNSNTPRMLVHNAFTEILQTKPLLPEHITFCITMLENIYQRRFAKIKQKQVRTNYQIQKLRDMRQSLIQKNLAGTYSDADFKEQFDLIEGQLQNMSILNKQTLLERYTKQNTQDYIKAKVTDLAKAYEGCDIKQKRTLISLLFPRGLMWNYPGLSII